MWAILKLAFGFLSGPFTHVFDKGIDYLAKRVDAAVEMRKSDNTAAVDAQGNQLNAIRNADTLNAGLREREGRSSPWVIVTIGGFMLPFAWHTWQVCLDSSRWLPSYELAWGWLPYPTVALHAVGSWKVAALPGLFETTEHAVIQSLFIGASAALGGIAIIRAVRGK